MKTVRLFYQSADVSPSFPRIDEEIVIQCDVIGKIYSCTGFKPVSSELETSRLQINHFQASCQHENKPH